MTTRRQFMMSVPAAAAAFALADQFALEWVPRVLGKDPLRAISIRRAGTVEIHTGGVEEGEGDSAVR